MTYPLFSFTGVILRTPVCRFRLTNYYHLPLSVLMSHDGCEPLCDCGIAAERKVASTAANQGREFWTCASRSCKYFKWCDGRGNPGRGGYARGRGGSYPRFGGRGVGAPAAAPRAYPVAVVPAPRQAYGQPAPRPQQQYGPPPAYDPYGQEAQVEEEGIDPISDQDMFEAEAEVCPPPAAKKPKTGDDVASLRDILVTSAARLTAVLEKCDNLCLSMERALVKLDGRSKPDDQQSQQKQQQQQKGSASKDLDDHNSLALALANGTR